MSGAKHWEQDKESTLYIGNLDERCGDALVWELMLQAGPVINVHLPKDRVTQSHQGYGFVEFGSEEDADYAAKIMNQIRLWGKPIRVNKASADKRGLENGGLGGGQGVGAELFIGNLDTIADEKVLYETFSRFGPLVAAPKVARDESNLSKGYGFVSYASFDSSDQAIEHMHGQYLMNKEITVQYAYKKDGKGERHGDAAERALAEQARKHGVEVAIPALPAALVMPQNTPSAPAAMSAEGYENGGMNGIPGIPGRPTPQPPPNYGGYGYAPPHTPHTPHTPTAFHQPQHSAFAPPPPSSLPTHPGHASLPAQPPPGLPPNGMPPRNYNQSPLQTPPSAAGLPARPPASNAGYGGPPQNVPGFPPGMPAPPGLPVGFRPPPPPQGFPGQRQ